MKEEETTKSLSEQRKTPVLRFADCGGAADFAPVLSSAPHAFGDALAPKHDTFAMSAHQRS